MSAIHSATNDEKNKLRANGRYSAFGLVFPASNVVWKARINQATIDLSFVSYIDWDTQTTGNYANIKEGMTIWIGSADGLSDVGKIRVRGTATATRVFFDAVSNIRFADNLYLTVVDDFEIKAIQYLGTSANDVTAMGVAYTNQNVNYKPIVIMGGEAVLKLTGGTASVTKNAADSWLPDGTITAYAWACDTASSVDNSTTASATFNFSTTGTHLISLQITGSNSETSKRYQKIIVWDENAPYIKCDLETPPYGTEAEGGFECSVRCLSDVDRSSIKPDAKVILFAVRELFDGVETSIGQCLGSENVMLSGWIAGETIKTDAATGEVVFSIRGTTGKMKLSNGQAYQYTTVRVAPTGWSEMNMPKLIHIYWHYVTWRTTLAQCVDCYPPDDETYMPSIEGSAGDLYQQLSSIGANMFARVGSDIYGRLFFDIDPEMLSDSDKNSVTEVMELTDADRAVVSTIDRQPAGTSAVYLSAQTLNSASVQARTVYSVSPGVIELPTGVSFSGECFASNQADANSKAGRLLAKMNNGETISVAIPENNRLIGLYPNQIITITIPADDTPLNDEITGRFKPTSLQYLYDRENGALSVELSGKLLKPEELSANGIVPAFDSVDSGIDIDSSFDLGGFDGGFSEELPQFLLPDLPELPEFPNEVIEATGAFIVGDDETVWYTNNFDSLDPNYFLVETIEPSPFFRYLIKTPDGHIYAIFDQKIMWATVDNPSFKTLIDKAFLKKYYPDTGALVSDMQYISAVGASLTDPNKIVAIIGSGYLGLRRGNIWTGDNTGLTQGVELSNYPNSGGTVYFSQGHIFAHYATGGALSVISVKISGDASSEETIVTPGLNYVSGIKDFDNSLYLNYDYPYQTGFLLSDNDGMTAGTIFPAFPTAFLSAFFYRYPGAVSPSGNRFMTSHADGGRHVYRSDDGGATFDLVTLPANFECSSIVCIDENRWVMGGRENLFSSPYMPLIYYTDDFGDTWFPKYGDLPFFMEDSYRGIQQIVIF